MVTAFALLAGCMGPWQTEWDPVVVTEAHAAGSIVADTTWTADLTWILDDIVWVEGEAQLTIEPGTQVLGAPGSALVVTRDATLLARGTPEEPIVFTSAAPVGTRAPGDWGGLVLLGNAPTNVADARLEGISDDPRSAYGGADVDGTCGTLEYVRVEFAGFEAFQDNELNGITFGGCGSATIARNLQAHRTLDDGIEMFGGAADLEKVLITYAGDDALDWDLGWSGRVQFLAIAQDEVGDNGFESDNGEADHDALPRSAPELWNVTLVGSQVPDTAQRGMTLRHGTAGTLRNLILTGFTFEAIDVRDPETVAQAEGGALSVDGVLLWNIGAGGTTYFSDESGAADDDDGGFSEEAWVLGATVALIQDPLLPAGASDVADLVPALESPASGGLVPPQGEFWDQGANYLGAFRPGASVGWADGWTAFPAD